MNPIRRIVRSILGAILVSGVGACGGGGAVPDAAPSGGGRAGSGSHAAPAVAGTLAAAGASGAATGYGPGPAAGASGSSSGDAGSTGTAGSAGTSAPVERAATFEPGSDPNRNKVSAVDLCTRLAAINCAAEAYCCPTPTRSVETCQVDLTATCKNELFLDQIAANPITGFDAEAAERAYTELERKASSCDPSVTAWGSSHEGLRGILKGTLAPASDCTPLQALADPVSAAAALVACAQPQSYACGFTSLFDVWKCSPKVGAGGTCNTDNNCLDGLFCALEGAATTGLCSEQKPVGAACSGGTQCASWFCKAGKCVAADQSAAYCLQD